MKKTLSFFLFVTLFPVASFASPDSSQKIAQAVKMMKGMALSGVSIHNVKPATSIKGWMYNLAVKEKHIDNPSDFNWVGENNEAWSADSMSWGSTNMKGAYAYVTEFEDGYLDALDQRDKAKAFLDQKRAKEAFKLLLKTGVLFGLAPMGAIQCGVTFAALAIVDPQSGKIYLFAKEGSGC